MKRPKRIPYKQLQLVYDMAVEMSGSSSYGEYDEETSNYLGREREVLKALNMVREAFGLAGEPEL
jgi:hypothetical protein